MNNNSNLLRLIVPLVFAALACGSEVQVNTPGASGARVTATPKTGSSRSNPAVAGSEVVIDSMGFSVVGSTRPATDIILSGNQFNKRPETGQEYVLIDVRIHCKKAPDEKCAIYSYNLKLLGRRGVQVDPQLFLSGVEGLLDLSVSEFFGGAILEGAIPFIIETSETELLLVYSPLLGTPFFLEVQ